jgi:hypothetical protein
MDVEIGDRMQEQFLWASPEDLVHPESFRLGRRASLAERINVIVG